MAKGIRFRVNVTPTWWRKRAESAEQFSEWVVQAVRVVLGEWPRAEIRMSKQRLVAVVEFPGTAFASDVREQRQIVREKLDRVTETDRSDSVAQPHVEFADPRVS